MRKERQQKYHAVRTEYGGRKYDSKFEAAVAADLDSQILAGIIAAWEPQYKVEMVAYDHTGKPVMRMSHKVDFRVHNNDGSFTLLEAKGFETRDYIQRRNWLEKFWLPEHPDHDYVVIRQHALWSGKRKK